MAQFDLLRWVADGCTDGVYQGTSYRVSARALHNRGLLHVSGSGRNWAARITPDGTQRLEEQAKRVEAERERLRQEQLAEAERERERQRLQDRAAALLGEVVAAGGRLDLGPGADPQDVQRMQTSLSGSGLLPDGQRLAQESTRMDPVLGVSVYLEPDFETLTSVRSFTVPRQLRNPHPAVRAFQDQKALVSKGQIGRAARFLQALVLAATAVGWKVSTPVLNMARGGDDGRADLALALPSSQFVVTIRELDQRGRHTQPYLTQTDYYTHTERTIPNKYFTPSGNLEVTVTNTWRDKTALSLRDTGSKPLESQLPVLIRKLEIAEAEADWSRQEESRRDQIREIRWREVKAEAFTKLTYERNAEQLHDQLRRRQAVATMRVYADEIEARAGQLDQDRKDAVRWAAWIRQHADRTDPLNGALRPLHITSAKHEDLAPHMSGWSTYGPYR